MFVKQITTGRDKEKCQHYFSVITFYVNIDSEFI